MTAVLEPTPGRLARYGRSRVCVRHGLPVDRTEGVWHHAHAWEECAPSAGVRHGRYDWSDMTPVTAAVTLAAMMAVSADTASPKADRHCTVGELHQTLRRQLDPRARTWHWRAVDNSILSLDRRGALRLHGPDGARLDWWAIPRLLDTDLVYVDAWPVPGGAPW